jgi:hypothetical protein
MPTNPMLELPDSVSQNHSSYPNSTSNCSRRIYLLKSRCIGKWTSRDEKALASGLSFLHQSNFAAWGRRTTVNLFVGRVFPFVLVENSSNVSWTVDQPRPVVKLMIRHLRPLDRCFRRAIHFSVYFLAWIHFYTWIHADDLPGQRLSQLESDLAEQPPRLRRGLENFLLMNSSTFYRKNSPPSREAHNNRSLRQKAFSTKALLYSPQEKTLPDFQAEQQLTFMYNLAGGADLISMEEMRQLAANFHGFPWWWSLIAIDNLVGSAA